MSLRILVTGSRSWTDKAAIERALGDALATYTTIGKPVLIHGAAAGADMLAHETWEQWRIGGMSGFLGPIERYPAGDFPNPRARNQHMVDLGATVCLAFAHTWASGTGMCARMARRAGIPVVDLGVPTGSREAS